MNIIPYLRPAPPRIVSPANMRGPLLDSMPQREPAVALRQTVALPAQGAQEPEPLDTQKPPLGVTGPKVNSQAEAKAPPARSWQHFQHSERMGNPVDAAESELSFGDFLDIINPLQHIPVVSTIYRALTDDEISPSASIFGGFLFGGPLGFVMAIANAIFKEASGQDLGETALAALLGDDTAPDVQTAQTPSANSTAASLEVPTPTQDSQALTAATAMISPAWKAGDYFDSSENFTGQLALDAFVRDLRNSEQLGRTARAGDNSAQTEISAGILGPPVLPKTGHQQSSARSTSPAVAMQNLPGMTETKVGPATQNLHRNIQSLSEPKSDLPRDNPDVLVSSQAPVPDARLLDSRTMGATLPASAFAERMLHALDKYQAMARKSEKNGSGYRSAPDVQI